MPTRSREIGSPPVRAAPPSSDFELAEVELPDPADGEVLVRNAYVSVDPYMRGRMNDAKSYVPPFSLEAPLTGGAVGRVIASRNDRWPEGAWVLHDLGWREAALLDGRGMRAVDPALAPISAALGVLGMPGITAYVGIVDIGDVREGDTVFVSGAAGAVGSVAAQLARAQGRPRDRERGDAGEGRLAPRARARRRLRLSRDADAGGAPRACAGRARRVLRQRRRGDARGRDRRDAAARADRRVRSDLALQRDRGAARPAQPLHGRDEAPADAGVHRLRPLRPLPRVPRGGRAARRRSGSIRYRETVVEGIEQAPAAFIGMLDGANVGKMLVRVGPEP